MENKSEKLITELGSIGMKVIESYTSIKIIYIQFLKIK
jgi:hypothetical protein